MTKNKQQPTPKIKPLVSNDIELFSAYNNDFFNSMNLPTREIKKSGIGEYEGTKGTLQLTSRGVKKKNTENSLDIMLKTGEQVISSFDSLTNRVLMFMNKQLVLDGQKSSYIEIKAYQEACGLKDYKQAREQLIDTLYTLYFTDIYFPSIDGHFRILESYIGKSVKGFIFFSYSNSFYNYLQTRGGKQFMEMPNGFFKIDLKRNPNASPFLTGFVMRRRNNADEKTSRMKVETLLKRSYLQSYDEIKDKGEINRRIIEPFERDLDSLKPFFSWKYCHEKGKPLSAKENETYFLSFDKFNSLYVEVEWKITQNYNTKELRNKHEKKTQQKQLKAEKKKLKKKEKELEEREQALQSYT